MSLFHLLLRYLTMGLIFSSCGILSANHFDITDIGTLEGTTLTLHPGEQLLQGRVVIPETIREVRGSEGSVLRFKGVAPEESECLGTLVRDHDELTLRDFTIIGDHDGRPLGLDVKLVNGIGIRKVEQVTIANVTVRNVAGMGINLSGCRKILVRDCTVKNVGRDGITSYGRAKSKLAQGQWIDDQDPNNRLIEELTVVNNTIENTGDDAIACWLSSAGYYTYHAHNRNVTIANNTITGANEPHEHSIGRGIALGGVEHGVIMDNRIRNMPTQGIYVGVDAAPRYQLEKPARSCEDIVVIRNVIEDTGRFQGKDYLANQAAIYLQEVISVQVKENRISGVYVNRTKPAQSGQGVRWIDSEQLDIDGNQVERTRLTYQEETR